MANYNCFDCKKVILAATDVDKCPSCGGTNGEVITNKHVEEGLESRAFHNIDPKTRKPKKEKK